MQQFEDNINDNVESKNNGMSIQERDSIVDDLLNQYRSQIDDNKQVNINIDQSQIDSIINNHSNSNYFANLQNVSYDAYCINDIDQNPENNAIQLLDWIDTLQIPLNQHQQDLIYNDNINNINDTKTNKMKRNLKNLKKKQKQKEAEINITRPNDFRPFYNYNKYRRSKKKQSLALEMVEKEEENLTFKPKINSYSFNRRIDGSVQRRLQIWNIQKKIKLNQQRKQKLEEDDYKIKENIPQIIKIRNNKKQRVHHRLFERENARIQKLEKTKQIIESQEMEQCPFKPKLQKSKLSNKIKEKFCDRAPIWKRQNDERKIKQNIRRDSKQKYDKMAEKDLTFKPKINKKSIEIVKKTKMYTSYYPINVSERLLLQNPKQKHSKSATSNNNKPSINPTSEKILKESVLFHEAADNFFKRQQIYELERKMKEAENQRDLNGNNKNNDKTKGSEFKPNIGNAEKILAKSKRHRYRYHFEDRQQKYHRLAFHDKQIIKTKTKIRAKELQKKNTFKPKINKKSAKIGRPSSIYELFQPEKSNKLKYKIQKEAEKIFKKQHPFKPPIKCIKEKRKSRCFSYKQYQDQKNKKLLEARQKLDQQKMKECTFKPQINTANITNKSSTNGNIGGNVLIAGWDRFKELKQLSLKKQMEIEQREYDVFNVNAKVLKCRKKNANGTLHTITKPFNLALNKKKCDNNNNTENYNGDIIKYSFKPETILSRQRDKVWQILKDECYNNNDNESSIFDTNDSFSTDFSTLSC